MIAFVALAAVLAGICLVGAWLLCLDAVNGVRPGSRAGVVAGLSLMESLAFAATLFLWLVGVRP